MNFHFDSLDKLRSAGIRGVFTDLDDTVTSHFKVLPTVYESLWRLHDQGLWLVLVSGRPAGWADCLMRMWPLDAMVFENGAGLMVREGDHIRTLTLAPEQDRDRQRERLQAVFERLRAEVPRAKLATDQPYRLFDFALDYAEESPHLETAELEKILELLSARTTLPTSELHPDANYWCGRHTKITACKSLLEREGARRGITAEHIVYSGDSPNDEPLFAFFHHTVGVANIRKSPTGNA